ncbi:hypothetical protein WDU99_01900 [Microbacterium sp. Mu-80]|uniref:Minor tail protein n=1 Tax=Microbacterium bandirmense TaxID=3122050 RepID=A0ABU8L6W3_9MICO
MSVYTYTGLLTDVAKVPIGGWLPQMAIRPVVEAYGPDGLVSAVPVPITIDAAGAFSVQLIPSGELTPTGGGSPGVDYIISVGRFELGDDNTTTWTGTDSWRFTAAAGGGNIGEMNGASLLAVWIGPPWPTILSPGLYIDQMPPNEYGIVT